jgi:hypothetical protein
MAVSELRDAEMVVRDACCAVANRPDVDSPSLRDGKAVSGIINTFFVKTDEESFRNLLAPLKIQPEYKYMREIADLKDAMVAFRRAAMAISLDRNDSFVNSRLQNSTVDVVRQMYQVIETYHRIVTNNCRGEVRQKARDIANAASDGLGCYNRGYGEEPERVPVKPGRTTGSAALEEFFSAHAVAQQKRADLLQGGVVVALIVIAALAVWILFLSPFDSDTLGRAFARLSTAVPLAVLAGYLGRESSRHRNTAARSGELGAHFSNLDSYVMELSEDDRRRYRYELGQKAFIADKHGAGETSSPGFVEEAARLVKLLKGIVDRDRAT